MGLGVEVKSGSQGHRGRGDEAGGGGGLGGGGVGGVVAKVWFGLFVMIMGVCTRDMFVQISIGSSSERRVLRRASTTSTGKRAAKGFP